MLEQTDKHNWEVDKILKIGLLSYPSLARVEKKSLNILMCLSRISGVGGVWGSKKKACAAEQSEVEETVDAQETKKNTLSPAWIGKEQQYR